MKSLIPKINPSTLSVIEISTAAISDILSMLQVPGTNLISKSIELYSQHKIESARKILFEIIASGEINLLKDPDYEAIIPNMFAYFEAAQRGEYNHNLKLLASILKNDFSNVKQEVNLRQITRRIESMTIKDLELIATIDEIYNEKNQAQILMVIIYLLMFMILLNLKIKITVNLKNIIVN